MHCSTDIHQEEVLWHRQLYNVFWKILKHWNPRNYVKWSEMYILFWNLKRWNQTGKPPSVSFRNRDWSNRSKGRLWYRMRRTHSFPSWANQFLRLLSRSVVEWLFTLSIPAP